MKSIRKLSLKIERTTFAENITPYGRAIRDSKGVAEIVHALIGTEAVEVLIVLHLDARNHLVGYTEVARGGMASCAVAIGDVLRPLVVAATPGFIVAHNHPSGDPSPSPDDTAITKRIQDGAHLLGIKLLDHVIVGQDFAANTQRSFSYLDAGLLPPVKS